VARHIQFTYQDPVDCIWIDALSKLNMRLERSREVYASWDGDGTLTLASEGDFDADDSLAQLIFHELCHRLVADKQGAQRVDWGLDNTDTRDLIYEHACHRLQAALATPYGLRDFMAVTTEWRPYWDDLPADALAETDDPAVGIAREAMQRAQAEPFASVLSAALQATAAIADVTRSFAPANSLWRRTRARHVSGHLKRAADGKSCGDCTWSYRPAEGRQLRCRQTKQGDFAGVPVLPELAACERWEAPLDAKSCGDCGACCHRGFDLVPVSARDPFRKTLLPLLVVEAGRAWLPRPDGRCVLLTGQGSDVEPFLCGRYEERPRSCRLFEVSGDACLVARRRVGLQAAG
jgi:Putative zinc- or iron-chelating domain